MMTVLATSIFWGAVFFGMQQYHLRMKAERKGTRHSVGSDRQLLNVMKEVNQLRKELIEGGEQIRALLSENNQLRNELELLHSELDQLEKEKAATFNWGQPTPAVLRGGKR